MKSLTFGLIGLFGGIAVGIYAASLFDDEEVVGIVSEDSRGEGAESNVSAEEGVKLVGTGEQDSSITRKPGETRPGVFVSEEDFLQILSGLGPEWISPIPENAEAFGPEVGGVPHGEWALYYEHKELTDTGKFVFGSRFGDWLVHDKNGNVLRRRTYINGKIEGIMFDRDSVNDPWYEFDYINGELVDGRHDGQ